jgi:hypothetical protein
MAIAKPTRMTHKAPDSPDDRSVDEELNDTTRESMDRLGHPGGSDEPDEAAAERDDISGPGQNSDDLPQ